uniref:AbrB/MazE/SpoVT family DNA-binding domain-containing protein n=1 Tax=Acidobacterium capsulatum TaxID=33075 RepID=A0A7V4XV35_9BACT
MALTSTVSSKGQVTIPREIRTRLGLKEGDRVEFVVEDDKTVLKPVRDEENPFKAWVGAFPAFKNREEINAWISEMRDEDPEVK